MVWSGDLRLQQQAATIVEHAHAIARPDRTRLGVGWMKMQDRSLFIDARAIAEGRVHTVVVLGRDQLQRVLAAQRLVTEARFHRRSVFQALRAEFTFAGWRAELAMSEGQERGIFGCGAGSYIETHEVLAIQTLQRDPVEEWMPRAQERPDHVVFWVAEAGVVETHPQRERAECI